MKSLIKYSIAFSGVIFISLGISTLFTDVFADTLQSDDYQIDGATIDAGGNAQDDASNYMLFSTISDFSGNPRMSSTSYELRTGDPEIFLAHTPQVSCFETTSDGSSSCTSGPTYVQNNGMVTVCGHTGCYDRARIEIDTQENPTDTLYSIQISEDGFNNDIRIIDWTTRQPKSFASRTMNDYQTNLSWEDYDNSQSTGWLNSYNIEGLDPDIEYSVRVTALHGDFTETEPSPIVTATTSHPYLALDIDIDDTTGSSTENNSPYSIHMELTPSIVSTADDLIWLDIHTNSQSGMNLAQQGLYGALYSSTYTINSATEDLTIDDEGFGLQTYSTAENYDGTEGELGTIATETDYAGAGDYVGQIDTSFIDIFTSTLPIHSGRTSIYVKAKPSVSAHAGNYTETISFVLTAGF